MTRSVFFLIAAGNALIACCYGFARFAYGLFAPVFTDTFELTPTLTGVIGAGSYVGYCAAIVLSLVLTERLGARWVAAVAGAVATVGISIVAVAPSAWALAVGVLVAGCSTGIASPPLAAAVAQFVPSAAADRAQTVVNGGTGIGVVLSAPIALLFFEQWRVAWVAYAILSVIVTVGVILAVPSSPSSSRPPKTSVERSRRPGGLGLLVASLMMGIGSIAVWTFGRDLIVTQGGADTTRSSLMWIVLGAAGIIGALAGDAVGRIGLRRAWIVATVTMASASVLLALVPSSLVAVITAAALFGAAYISLTGLLLLWSVRLYPDRTSFGVGVSFFTIAAGQALGAPAVGLLIDVMGASAAFVTMALVGSSVVVLRPAEPAQPRSN